MDTNHIFKKGDPVSQAMTLENPRFSLKFYWGTRFLLVPVLALCVALVVFLYSLITPGPIYQSIGFLPYSKLLTPLVMPTVTKAPIQASTTVKLKPLKERQKQYWPLVRRLARQYKVDPALVMAVIQVESCFRPKAVSPKGAMGLMQIVPKTAAYLGLKKPMNPKENIRAGIRYLSKLKKLFRHDTVMVLAAYNAGPTKVLSKGKIPDHKETRQYVTKVLAKREEFRARFQSLARR